MFGKKNLLIVGVLLATALCATAWVGYDYSKYKYFTLRLRPSGQVLFRPANSLHSDSAKISQIEVNGVETVNHLHSSWWGNRRAGYTVGQYLWFSVRPTMKGQFTLENLSLPHFNGGGISVTDENGKSISNETPLNVGTWYKVSSRGGTYNLEVTWDQ